MAIRSLAHGLRHVFAEHVLVVDDFHAAAAKHEARANHHRVATDLLDASEGFVDVRGHAAFRHRDAELVHHLAEQVAVFGDVDGVDAGTENLHAAQDRTLIIQQGTPTFMCSRQHDSLRRVAFGSRSLKARAMFSGVWPPNCTITPAGF